MMVWLLFIIDLMGLFFYTKIGSIISIGDLPTTNIIEPIVYHIKLLACMMGYFFVYGGKLFNETVSSESITDSFMTFVI